MSILLRPMTAGEYEHFYRQSIELEAKERMKDDRLSPALAHSEAEKAFTQLLPQGLNTPSHFLMTLEAEDTHQPIGFLWTLHEETDGIKQNFLCDFLIYEPHRRRGYGTQAVKCMESHAAEAGCRESVLFVAEHNHAALSLYQKCGYRFLRSIKNGSYMIKTL